MPTQNFIQKLKSNPTSIKFTDTMQVIKDNYNFSPTTFTNGELKNNADENSGSCKLFAFAIRQQLTKEETLFCFGEHYATVLEDESGDSH